jgi:hypothetical protein
MSRLIEQRKCLYIHGNKLEANEIKIPPGQFTVIIRIADRVGTVTEKASSAPGFFAKAEMGSIRFQRRKIFLAVIAFGGPRSSCSGRGAQLPFGTLCTTGLRK